MLSNKPYLLFPLTAIVLFILSFFLWGQSIDLHIHDTYFIISTNYFIWSIALIFFSGWGLYQFTDKILWTKKLIWIHVLTTLFTFLVLATFEIWHDKILPPIKAETISLEDIFASQKRERLTAQIIAIIFIAGQLAYIINLVAGIFKRSRQRNLPD